MNERFALIRKKLGLTTRKFGERLNITCSAITNMEKGTRNITDRTISDVCREFNVNENWLRTGEGSMFLEFSKSENDETKQMLIKILQNQNDMKELLNSKSNTELSNQFLTDLSKVFNIISPEHAKKLTDHLAPYIFGFLTACNEEYMDKLMFLIKDTNY